jgi:uncharacterized cupredoxin-like copper-binding protein
VSEFVEECRREWKRLRVPRPIADEMADDLTADLQEAEADGASVEEVLGSGASDPRAFAAAWASERGIIPRRRAQRLRRSRLLTVILLLVVALAVVAAAGVVVALLAVSGNSSAPRSTVATIAPSIMPGAVIGTAVGGATVPPSNIALSTGRRTILHRRPRSITITFVNRGTQTVALAHLTVQIYSHTYHFTAAQMAPDSSKRIRITLPADLPRRFTIRATTQPVPGEANTTNNRATWRVAIPK